MAGPVSRAFRQIGIAAFCALFMISEVAAQSVTASTDSSESFRVRIGHEGNARVLSHMDAEVIVILDDAAHLLTGFDLRIGFDKAALKFRGVIPSRFLTDGRWEHFDYTLGDTIECDSGCPSGVLRVSGDYRSSKERPYQVDKRGATLSAIVPAKLFTILFQATSDRTFDGVTVPIEFCWSDCGDNQLRYVTDLALNTEHHAFASRVLSPWPDRAPTSSGQPRYCSGMPAGCLNDEAGGATVERRSVEFVNGYITVGEDYFIDGRGDIDLNGVEYEERDVAMLLEYFKSGRSAFIVNVQGQIAASDANRDGHTLSSSDFVYLWRQVYDQAKPAYVLRPDSATCTIHDGVISVDKPMQAVQVVLEGESSFGLLLDGWATVYHFDDSVTRILIYDQSPDMSQTFEGEFLKVYGNVVSIDLSTPEGAWVDVTIGRP